jgi:hypothetical protein
MNRTTLSIAFVCAVVVLAPEPVTAQVPDEYLGDWVTAAAACSVPLRFRVEATTLTLVGADSESFGGVQMAGPAFWGPDYKGIMAVAFAEFDGAQPVIATFNLNEKKGSPGVEFTPVTPGANAAYAPINARLLKLNLAKRFPFEKVPLKKCPAA